jgi:hypothetical protein
MFMIKGKCQFALTVSFENKLNGPANLPGHCCIWNDLERLLFIKEIIAVAGLKAFFLF